MSQSSPSGQRAHGVPSRIPDATVARLPVYLRALTGLQEAGCATVSSQELARLVGGASAQVRKDLSRLGTYGTRGVGYEVAELVEHVGRELGLTRPWPVVLVGAGNLGHALAGYAGFAGRGFRIAALLDSDASRVGELVAGRPVQAVAELAAVVDQAIAEDGACIGVIATPAGAAQGACQALVAAGVTSILNFAPVVLAVPDGVDVRKVDLASELQILAFHASRREREQVPA